MVFSSLSFIFFFLPALLIIYTISKDKYRNYILFIFSLFFYSWGEPKYVFLMIFSIIVNYYFGLQIEKQSDKKKRKQLLIISLFIHIGLLFYFKYVNFFISIFNNLKIISLKNIDVALPIGISFYTFQEISYLIDIYHYKIKSQKNIFYLGTYISFFPQLIAGPIVRYKDIEKQLDNRKYIFDQFCDGIRKFIIGFGKKVLIANNVALIVDCIFDHIIDYGFLIIGLGTLSFAIQIYYDFSGYSDMAIGLAKIFGFDLMENFNYPYSATSIKDFWRRWHISLSSWFRDYVYIPLGGNKVSTIKNIRNILIVWLLTGLWHGAGWNYIIWGLYFGILLLIEHKLEKKLERVPKAFRWIITFILINISWLFFKIENLYQLKIVLRNIITFKPYNFMDFLWDNYNRINNSIFILIGILFMFPILNIFKKYENNSIYCYIRDVIIIIIFLLSIASLINNSYNPFLYFKF